MESVSKLTYQKMSFADYEKQKQDKIEKILTMFENMSMKDLSYKLAETYVTKIGAPMEKWSFMNQLLAELADTTDARTFKAWQKVNRRVKGGEKAFYIWKPISKMVKEYDLKYFNTEEKEHHYKIRYLKMSEELSKNQTMLGIQFGLQAEFGIEQTEGEEIKYENEPLELPPLVKVCKRLGIKIQWKKYDGMGGGYYSPKQKKIVLNAYDEKVFFHELTHAVQEYLEGKIKGGQDVNQETIAEFSSCVIASIYGIDTTKQAFTYIFHYAKNDKETAMKNIHKNLDTIKKILDFVFQCEGTKN